MIDQAFVVFGSYAEFGGDVQAETKAGDLAVRLEAHRAEQFSKQLGATARVILVKKLADAAYIHAASHQFGADLKSARCCVRVLERARVGRNRDEKVFRD